LLKGGELREYALFIFRGQSFVESENRFYPVFLSG
jgi:hypothetical protein